MKSINYDKIIKNRWCSLNQRCVNGKYTTSPSAQKCQQLVSYRLKGITLDMTFEQFNAWMLENEQLHNEIVASGEKSSIDRISDNLGYRLDNIQMISLHSNIEKREGKICKRSGNSVEKNKNQYKNIKKNKIIFNDIIFKNKKELAIYLNINVKKLEYDIKIGKVVVEDVNGVKKYPQSPVPRKYLDKKIEYQGKFFKTQNELAKYLGFSTGKLSRMIKNQIPF